MKRTQQDLIRVSEEAAAWLLRLQTEDSPETRAEFDKWIRQGAGNLEEFLFAQMMFSELDRLDLNFDPGSFAGNDSVIEFPNASPRPFPSIENVSTELTGEEVKAESSSPAPLIAEEGGSIASLPSFPSHGDGRGEAIQSLGEASTRRRWPWISGLAASLVLAVGLLVAPWPLGSKVYSTKVGSQEAIKLDDGSVIHLNTHSKAQVNFSKELREVRLLQGEALFTVAHDASRPFIVITDTARVRAIGTQFNVYRSGTNQTKVSVIEGVVQVTTSRNPQAGETESSPQPSPAPGEIDQSTRSPSPGERQGEEADGSAEPEHRGDSARAIRLAAGDQVAIVGTKIVKAQAPDVERAVAWRSRRLMFEGNPVAEIAEEFNRYNAQQIRVEGEQLRTRKVTGVFDADDPSTVIRFIARDANVEVIKSENEILIRPRSTAEE